MAIPVKKVDTAAAVEAALVEGDLSKLTTEQRTHYYNEVCKSLGLNPLTRPCQYIVLNNKLQLYALRACTDQLRKINMITLTIISREVADGLLTVHVRAVDGDGRADEDIGVVPFPDTLKGDARANTEMKAVTKAKRRATLSLCGLGWLDETEIETIKDAKPVAGPDAMRPGQGAPADRSVSPPDRHGASDNQRRPVAPTPEAIAAVQDAARAAARQGSTALADFWRNLATEAEQQIVGAMRGELITLRDQAEQDQEPHNERGYDQA